MRSSFKVRDLWELSLEPLVIRFLGKLPKNLNTQKPNNLEAGQSMIEVVVGLSVATLLAVALITATIYTQKLSRSAKNGTQATKIAQEAIEQMRVIRDRKGYSYISTRHDSADFGSKILTVDPDPANWVLTAAAACPAETIQYASTEPVFSRCITVQDGNNDNQKKITVTVTWTEAAVEGSGARQVVNTTFLSKACDIQIGAGPTPCP